MRITPYSAAAAGRRSRRASSRSTALRVSSGRSAVSTRSRSSRISACSGSPSPSSSWIAFICWRRKNSRWPFSISDWTCDWIFVPSSKTSSSRFRIRRELAQPRFDVRLLEELLLLLGLQPQRRGDEVGERARVVHVRGGELELGRKVRDEARRCARRASGRSASAPRARASPRRRRASARTPRRSTDRPGPGPRAGCARRPGRGCGASRRGP